MNVHAGLFIVSKCWYSPGVAKAVSNAYASSPYTDLGAEVSLPMLSATGSDRDGFESLSVIACDGKSAGRVFGIALRQMARYSEIDGFRYQVAPYAGVDVGATTHRAAAPQSTKLGNDGFFVVTTCWYPPTQAKSVAEAFRSQQPLNSKDGLTQPVFAATTSDRGGYETLSVIGARVDAVGLALEHSTDQMARHRDMEGFRYKVGLYTGTGLSLANPDTTGIGVFVNG